MLLASLYENKAIVAIRELKNTLKKVHVYIRISTIYRDVQKMMFNLQKISLLLLLGFCSCQNNRNQVPNVIESASIAKPQPNMQGAEESLTPEPIPSEGPASPSVSTEEISFPPFITGFVLDTEGQPVEGALVMIKSKVILPEIDPDKLFQFAVKTDETGEYTIRYPKSSPALILSASKENYITVSELITPEQAKVFNFGGTVASSFPPLEKAPEDIPTDHMDALPYITGKVLDFQGQPVSNATITLMSTEIEPTLDSLKLFEFSVKTNAEGDYRIAYPVVLSEFILSASKEKYITVSQVVKPEQGRVFNFGGASLPSFPSLSFCKYNCPSN